MPELKLLRDGLQDRFLRLRTPIQVYGGGYGNGKTVGVIVKVLELAQVYPGMNCLMSRATYPKLNDTLRNEFIKWCPKDAIASFPKSPNSPNTCTLKNGTQFPFRYIQQQGKSEEGSTSNLLSATYDCIVVDQLEDPEITYKDFLDLVGRLRGSTVYRGDDPTMPRTGPGWMLLTLNPTRNWAYHQIVKPIHIYNTTGEVTEELLCLRDPGTNKPVLGLDGKPQLLISLVEGSTYENRHVLPKGFIQLLESTYRGQQADRYLKGLWVSYEGLVYPEFNELTHMIDDKVMERYLDRCIDEGWDIEWIEAYDYGKAVPSCYLAGFVDHHGNVHYIDGFYKKEYPLDQQFEEIKKIRRHWDIPDDNHILADPDIFRRGKGMKHDERISDLFWTDGHIQVVRASNEVMGGITKASGYLAPRDSWINPYTRTSPAPSMYFARRLQFVANEMGAYFWKKDSISGQRIDEPQDKDDHALDTMKYGLTNRPLASKLKPQYVKTVPAWMHWQEQPDEVA
jgi:hypothetical protein